MLHAKSKNMIWIGLAALVCIVLMIMTVYVLNKPKDPESIEPPRLEEAIAAPLFLVKDGKAGGVIVLQNDIKAGAELDEFQTQLLVNERMLVNEFQSHLLRATGVELPVISIGEMQHVPDDQVRVLIGSGSITDGLGITVAADDNEQAYRVAAVDNQLVLMGSDLEATSWAVYDFLDRHLGVKWLWPGDVGTYVPKSESIPLPEVDMTNSPTVDFRVFNYSAQQEGRDWYRRHMLSPNSEYPYKHHGFSDWYGKYYYDHPEYFAIPPEGVAQPKPNHVKLDISNEAIDEVIIQEWEAAGKPDIWSIAPNDSAGYCISEACMAMDVPSNQSVMDVWTGKADLTARYVKFWNRLLKKMRAIHPQVMLQTNAYGAYRSPPPAGITLDEGILLTFVDSFWAYDAWQGWMDAGASGMILRPNWFLIGKVAPHLPIHEMGDFFKYAQENGMEAYFFDSLMGSWGTQGLNYYLIARLTERPEMSVDEVVDEYASAFGQAAPAIKDYFAYWEALTEKVKYPNAGTFREDGLYMQLQKEHGFTRTNARGGWYVMPYVYTDEVLGEARAILDQADHLAIDDDSYVHERIQFLRDGLAYLEITREVVRYGAEESRPVDATFEEYEQLVKQMNQMRDEMSTRHVVWGHMLDGEERRRNSPTYIGATKGWVQVEKDDAITEAMEEALE